MVPSIVALISSVCHAVQSLLNGRPDTPKPRPMTTSLTARRSEPWCSHYSRNRCVDATDESSPNARSTVTRPATPLPRDGRHIPGHDRYRARRCRYRGCPCTGRKRYRFEPLPDFPQLREGATRTLRAGANARPSGSLAGGPVVRQAGRAAACHPARLPHGSAPSPTGASVPPVRSRCAPSRSSLRFRSSTLPGSRCPA